MKPFFSFICIFLTVLNLHANQAVVKNETKYDYITKSLFDQIKKEIKEKTAEEMQQRALIYKEFKMPYDFITYGEKPEEGHSLYISMHGGGGAPAKTNDQQWKNQIKLYKPKEGIYLAPRAPTNTWDLWHKPHVGEMFAKLIDRFVAHYDVNINKVYILGYSAGGDGVYRLAPRMADRWAGAAMMAGHPGGAEDHNLMNLPYILQVGGKDTAYNRHKKCANWKIRLEKKAKEHPGLYPHKVIIYPKHGHWMNNDCKVAIPWMAKNSRNPWPKKIIWHQDHVPQKRFAWLENKSPTKNDLIKAEVKGQTITLETQNIKQITLRLHEALINLDEEIIVENHTGKQLFKGIVKRSREAIEKSLRERLDIESVAKAELEVRF